MGPWRCSSGLWVHGDAVVGYGWVHGDAVVGYGWVHGDAVVGCGSMEMQ